MAHICKHILKLHTVYCFLLFFFTLNVTQPSLSFLTKTVMTCSLRVYEIGDSDALRSHPDKSHPKAPRIEQNLKDNGNIKWILFCYKFTGRPGNLLRSYSKMEWLLFVKIFSNCTATGCCTLSKNFVRQSDSSLSIG